MESGHEIISTVILLPSADSRKVVVSHNKGLVDLLVKLAHEKKCRLRQVLLYLNMYMECYNTINMCSQWDSFVSQTHLVFQT